MIKEKVERRAAGEPRQMVCEVATAQSGRALFSTAFCSGLPERICAKVQCTNYKWSEKFQVLNLIDRFFLVPLTWT